MDIIMGRDIVINSLSMDIMPILFSCPASAAFVISFVLLSFLLILFTGPQPVSAPYRITVCPCFPHKKSQKPYFLLAFLLIMRHGGFEPPTT